MAGTKVPRDPNLTPEMRRFLDDMSRVQNIFNNLTATEATALLDVFTSLLKGLVPASGGGSSNFLRADGSWAVPPGTSTGGVSLVASAAASGGTVSITGLAAAAAFMVVLAGISHDSGSNQSIRVAVSDNNGSSYGTATVISALAGAAAALTGFSFIALANASGDKVIGTGLAGSGGGVETAVTGTINALQFSPSGGNFDAGNFYIYAMK